MATKNTRYTYITFANEVIAIANALKGQDIGIDLDRLIEKANDLINTQTAKQAYNKANPKKATAKGASEATQANANTIGAVLAKSEAGAMTAAEINATLGTEFTALQVANAVKFIEGATSVKVIRTTKNAKGLTAEKEYTAYFKA